MKDTLINLRRAYIYGKKYNKYFIRFIIGSICSIIINVIYPLVCAKQLLYISTSTFNQLIYASLVVLSVSVLSQINHYFINKNTQQYFRGVTRDIQCALAEEILKITNKELDQSSSGEFIQRLTSDTANLSHVFTNCINYIRRILSQLGIIISVFILNWAIGIYYLITIVILTIIHVLYAKSINKKDKIFRKQTEKVTSFTNELVKGVRDIKMLNSKQLYINEMKNNIDAASIKLFDMRNTSREEGMVVWSIVALFEFMLIAILIYFMRNGWILASTALIVYNYHNNVYESLMGEIEYLLFELKEFTLSSNRVFGILDGIEYKKEIFGPIHLEVCNGNFEFKNVCFAYNKKTQVLKDFNLKIDANKTYGIVGKSGEGKTTMFNLLCKMYDCKKGTITIDGVNINKLDEESIRGNITIISQNPYIFNMSIKDNLKLVKENITDEEIVDACKLACLNEFIEKLPDKYDTVVGEGGITLSGGQRQRLAIARAFIQKTKIILFDEATSALDNETQSNIQEAINNMKKDYTIVIIAHRLSTIINCDKIFYMEDGQIKSSGTHTQLLKKCKSYRDLYEYELKTKD